MNNPDETADEYDTPWKEILEAYFRDFMAFFLPIAHDNIDWQRGYEFLDTELSRIAQDAKMGDRRMDKLVKVWQNEGDEQWVLIHIEIQGNREANFPERMYTYQYRAFDLRRRPVVGLAILADEEEGWRPADYEKSLWGTRLLYRFTTVKLLDFLDHASELETSNNPFAMVTLAHLQAKKTRKQPEQRYQAKLLLIHRLYQRGFARQQVIDLFRFLDWVLTLPKEADKRLMTDPHSPNEWRINGTLANIPEFHKIFDVKEGDKMWRKNPVQIW